MEYKNNLQNSQIPSQDSRIAPKTLLVHICCSVDSHHFLSELRAMLPDTEFIGYFYNPNIHPEEEYQLRLFDVQRSCRMLNIQLIWESYDPSDWLHESNGLEHFPEKGERCSFCFDFRLEKSAQKALELGADALSTTLLASPIKSIEQLFRQGRAIKERFGLRFLEIDVRSKGGSARQQKLAKDSRLYRQNYCGCLYALSAQRERAQKRALELCSPISKARYDEGLFAKRMAALKERDRLEAGNRDYFWGREKQLLWQNLYALLLDSHKRSIPIHVIAHSIYKGKISLTLEREIERVFYFDKEGAKAITLEHFNKLTQKSYTNIYELIYSPPAMNEELELRRKLGDSPFGISPILVFGAIPRVGDSYKLTLHSFFQEENIEKIWEIKKYSYNF